MKRKTHIIKWVIVIIIAIPLLRMFYSKFIATPSSTEYARLNAVSSAKANLHRPVLVPGVVTLTADSESRPFFAKDEGGRIINLGWGMRPDFVEVPYITHYNGGERAGGISEVCPPKSVRMQEGWTSQVPENYHVNVVTFQLPPGYGPAELECWRR